MKKILSNEKVILRALEPDDVEQLYRWENDTDLWEVSHTLAPYSRYILNLYIQNSDKDLYEAKQLRLMIDTPEGKSVGAIDLFDFDPYHARAGVGILIYNRDDRSKGYAHAALSLLIGYCFDQLKMHQLYAHIETDNEASLALFQKSGFVITGTRKEWISTKKGWKDESMLQLINP